MIWVGRDTGPCYRRPDGRTLARLRYTLAPMSLPERLSLRDATTDDLLAIARLREAVGWAVHEWALRAVIGVPHARCILVEGGGALAAVGSGIVYGPIGFVGNMVVHPDHRRRGIGSAVLAEVTGFLDDAGCARLELNATPEGRPLYERHGFVSRGDSATTRIARDIGLARDDTIHVRVASAADLDEVAAYDRPRFGGDRRPLLSMLLADGTARLLAAARNGSLAGYACVRLDAPRIGPFLADDPAVAETLLAAAFDAAPAADDLRLNLPPANAVGAAWLRRLGVDVQPWDGRMARGAEVPRRDETVYGMAVGALG